VKRILPVFLLISLFILAGCGGGGGGNNGGDATLNYIPNFTFSNTTSASLEYSPTDWNEEQRQRYIMLSPFLIGFNKSSQAITNGKSYSYSLQNSTSNLALTASVSGSTVTLTGMIPNNSGNVTISINTANNTFSYEQLLKIKASSDYAAIYIKLTDVKLKENGYYQTKGTAYIAMTGKQSFLGQMEYYFGKGQPGHPYSDETNEVIGTYGIKRMITATKQPSLTQADIENMISTKIISYFPESDLEAASDPMVLYYDKTDRQFYATGDANQSFTPARELDLTNGPKQPWTLLP
jgi:hypothetical protein